ncbi:hypothetical protein GCM10029976_028560 [Kribbella albertanoniae]|uniref:DUF4303 domain-containing protein n=1 Tax=Kribbella albertanoniae TaxID=1266829 RepID=A0A4R4Q0H1_9ACTN|nr:DUF4303 domain-containing protein [Kribbella albertanoniae]TDC28374.1 DUF4303 domain-containing protein [Kribbella albertanoniae]
MTASFDWATFERELTDALEAAIRSALLAHRDEQFYAAALGGIYREERGVISRPSLGMNSVEALNQHPLEEQPDVRWSMFDWDHLDDDWLAEAQRWEEALTAEACRERTSHWESTFQRYLMMLVRVCREVRTRLRTSGVVGPEFLVLVIDDEHHELLVRHVLTPSEVGRHFPELDVRAAEVARVAALPESERAAYFVSRLGSFSGPIDSEAAEEALRLLGQAAAPGLVARLGVEGQAWQAAKLLGEIGLADNSVTQALDTALTRLGGADQAWTARALAFLGRLDLVVDKIGRLPDDVVVTAICAPYTSFRVAPLPLNYRPLEEALERWPEAIADELKPGRGYCEISADEAAEATRGLTSRYDVVRRHAALCLEALQEQDR